VKQSATAIVCGLLGALVAGCSRERAPLVHPPVVVMSPYRVPGVVVRGATRDWWKLATAHTSGAAVHPVRYGDPMPVGLTMYCLQGTTRRGRYVRPGIIAADPRFFPLSRYVELYAGRRYLGRFLVDDTGRLIRGARIDVWTPNCREARRFGVQRGTAVLVRPGPDIRQAGETAAKK
jgi:3D (Asp-Asp-Asp) domain-containing protein